MQSVRAARRYRWRLAGGRLVADGDGLTFVPNRLEARRPDTAWQAPRREIVTLQRRGRVWVEVETRDEVVAFRIFGTERAVRSLRGALLLGALAEG